MIFFQNRAKTTSSQKLFVKPSHWTPPLKDISEGTKRLISDLKRRTAETLSKYSSQNGYFINKLHNDNLTPDLRLGLTNLRADESIIIKGADKGGKVCVINRTDYIKEAERQLYNDKYYQVTDTLRKGDTILLINHSLLALENKSFIDNKQLDYLLARPEDQNRYFYLLPKIHKAREKWPSQKMPEGRPIVGDCATENRRVCDLIDSVILPLATKHKSYIKDTYDFVNKIRNTVIDPQ